MRLLRGRSTPAIRAIVLALTLLVTRVFLADDTNHTGALNHPAVLANWLYAAAYLHVRNPWVSWTAFKFIHAPGRYQADGTVFLPVQPRQNTGSILENR